jgi:curved DNA-binding protein CbpA
MRELEALKYQRQQQEKQQQQQQNGMYKNKMGYNTKPSSNIPPGSSSTTSNNQNLNQLENELLKKQAEMDEAKRQENIKSNEEAIQKKNEAIAKQREEAFEAELAKIRDENLKKKMQRQKQQDAKVVKRVLHNYAKGRHYAVLGFKIVCSMFGEMQVFGLPYLKLCSMNTSQIKSAYRQSAKLVHPDKNRDGHAAEAFDALEKSASLLLDPVKKKEYDLKLKRQRKELVHSFVTLIDSIRKSVVSFVDVARKVLGPFATPFLILFAVIV